jgi:hypothetical protein
MNELQQFELLEELRPLSSAPAVLLRWNGCSYVRTPEKIEIFDFIGVHGDRFDRGYARHSTDSQKWEAVGGLRQPAENWLPS